MSGGADGGTVRILLAGPLPPPIGGATVLFESLASGLAATDGVSVRVVGTGGVRGKGPAGLAALTALNSKLRTLAREVDVVSLHASTSGLHVAGPLAASAARSAGRPLIVRKFGGTDFMEYGAVRRAVILGALRGAALYLSETHELVESGRRLGLRSEWFPNSREMPPLPPLGGSPAACRRFVFLGHVRSEKGVRELIHAGEQLPDGVIVDVYGPLDFDVGSHEFAGLRRVRYKGVVEPKHVHSTLLGYDALVLPSYREGYPGAVLEAFGAGLPVVVSRIGGVREMVDDTCGLLVEPGDSAHLRNAMLSLVADAELCGMLRKGVRARREEFSSALWNERFIGFCRAASAPRGGSAGGRGSAGPGGQA